VLRSKLFCRCVLLCSLVLPVPLVLTSCGGGIGLTGIPIVDVILGAAFVSGLVRDAKTNQPIPNTKVSVKLVGAADSTAQQLTSGPDGGFTATKLAGGDYEFKFSAPGTAYHPLQIDVSVTGTIDSLSVTLLPTDITTTNINLTAAPPTVQLGKTAQYTADGTSGGTPLTVFWTVADPAVGEVNAAGKFTPLKPGTTTVYARLGPTKFSARITVTENLTAGALFGIVTSGANHEPVGGVTVTAAGKTVQTAADGTFTVEDVTPGSHTVAGHKGSLTGSAGAIVTANAGTRVSLQLK